MSADCPRFDAETAQPTAAEDRRRRSERRAAAGEVVIRAPKRPGRPPESLATLVAPDRRTKLGRALSTFRAGLLRHCGERPSETQRALIDVACQLRARLLVMDARFNASGETSAHDGRQYLAWSNSLSRTLKMLGLKGAPDKPPSLAEYLASRAAAAPTPRPASSHAASPQAAQRAAEDPDGAL